MSLRPRIIGTIWKKEISETLRDRRTLFIMIVLPVLLYPMLLMLFTRLAESESEAAMAQPSTIAVWGVVPPALQREFDERPHLTVRPWVGAPADVKEGLEQGTLPTPTTRPVKRRNERPRDPDVPPDEEEVPSPAMEAARATIASRQVDAVLVL